MKPPANVICLKLLLALFVIILLGSNIRLSALTISPQLKAKLEAEGVFDEFLVKFARWQEQLAGQPPSIDMHRLLAKPTAEPSVLTMKVCVLLVDFSDNTAAAGSVSGATAATVDNILFSQGTFPTGSMRDFYLESSFGQFQVDGDVYGWFRLPSTYAQYTGIDNGLQMVEPNGRTMARDAVLAADPTVNFAPYDVDLDGFVDALFIIHAGPGAEETGTGIWSHRWITSGQVNTGDGKKVYNYLTGPEEVLGTVLRVGVYAHEYGHILGLPDLYDVNNDYPGVGRWSLMAGGSWNNQQRTPAHFDGWCKHYLDSVYHTFGKTIDVNSNMMNVVLNSVVTDSVRYRIKIPSANGREYFMVENRQQVGFDAYIPGSGLFIEHCDDNLPGSNSIPANGHWRVSVEQADGENHLENNYNEGDGNDVFPGWEGTYTEFTDLTPTTPASWYGTPNQISVWDIRHDTENRTITCNFDLSYSRTNLSLQSSAFSDVPSGNGDGVFDKGETISVSYSFKNFWKTATGVSAKLTSATPGVTIVSGTNNHGTVNTGQTVSSMAPLTFSISPSITPINAAFDLRIISTSPPDTFTTSFMKFVGGVEILIVDGDDSPVVANFRNFVTRSLDTLFRPYAIWDLATQGAPGSAQYAYKYIIWFTGAQRSNITAVISAGEVAFLRNYLDQGGRLYLSGQDVAECLTNSADSTFLSDYLGVRFVSNYEPLDVIGVSGNPLSDNMMLRIRGQNGGSNQYDCDVLQILPAASKLFDFYQNPVYRGPAGCIYARPNGSRVVFTSFGLEAVTTNFGSQGYNTQYQFMQGVLDFLNSSTATDADDIVDAVPLPADFELHQNFPNPFNPTTQINYSVTSRLEGESLTLEVLNILGQRVRTLRTEQAVPGDHWIEFDASSLSSGVYFYRLKVGNASTTRKMLLSK